MVYDGALNTRVFLKFLSPARAGCQAEYSSIVDNLRVHHARIVVA